MFFSAVTFRNSYFFGEAIAYNKDIYRIAALIEAGTSAQHQLFQKSYIFENPFFKKTLPSIAENFSEELLSHNIFQKGCYFIATLHLLSYTLTIYQLVIK